MLYIDNLAEIIHIKSFIVPITQPHTLYLDEIDSDGGILDFAI